MNLVEVSDCLGKSIDELKTILLEQFDRIVLSEYCQLDEKVIKGLLKFLDVDEDVLVKSKVEYEKLVEVSHHEEILPVYNSSKKSFVKRQTQKFIDTLFTSDVQDEPRVDVPISDDERLLQELNKIEAPDVRYTKKLIKYCFDNNYLIFIDTCSLLNDHFYDFYNLFTGVSKEPLILYVPYVVVEELKSILIKKEKELNVLKKAKDRIGFIAQQCQINNMRIVGDENDKRTNEYGEKVIHADRVLIEKLIYFRNDSKSCLLITQDHGVTVDALKQNEWQSTKSHAQIVVKKIGKGGVLVDNSEDVSNPTLPIDYTSERNSSR